MPRRRPLVNPDEDAQSNHQPDETLDRIMHHGIGSMSGCFSPNCELYMHRVKS